MYNQLIKINQLRIKLNMMTSKITSCNPFRRNRMKTVLLTLIACGLMSINVNAQLYTRTTFNTAYVPITTGGGATISTATGIEGFESAIPLGFTYNYAGVIYTSFGLNTNGLLWFDAATPTGFDGNSNDRLYRTIGSNQSIAVWWNDMADDASSDILYQLQGSPGSQTFTVQYTNYSFYEGTTTVRINCQIVFYEGTNIIEFKYGSLNVTGGTGITLGAVIGIEYGAGGPNNYIDAVTGSKTLGNGLLSPLVSWPTYNFRFTPGAPSPIAGGTYNVGVGQTYPSLTQAVADLNHRGITGPVTLNLTDAQYDTSAANGSNIFPILVGEITGLSALNTLTISKIGTPATIAYRGSPVGQSAIANANSPSAIQSSQEPILGVCASYTTISNINLVSHGTMPHLVDVGLLVFGDNLGTQNSMFDKITVNLDRTNANSIGIVTLNTSVNATLPGTNSNNTYRDITIRDCYAGMYLGGVGTATQPHDFGNQIISSSCTTFNSIGDPSVPNDIGGGNSVAYGIWMQAQQNFILKNTIIRNVSINYYANTVDGIVIESAKGTCEISNNVVRTITRNVTFSDASNLSGMRISHHATTTNVRIFNNSISELLSTYTGASTTGLLAKGISFEIGSSFGTTYEIWNNSISIDGSTYPNGSTTCIEIKQGTLDTYNLKNNVLANFTMAQTGPAGHYCITTPQVDQIGTVTTSSDYNDFYIANDQGTSGHIGLGATTNYSTLATWQSGMSFHAGMDANSVSANPNFANNNSDLHATSSSTALNGTGTTLPAYLTTDFDCQIRTAPHDIGFDDFGVCTPIGGTVSPATANICENGTYNMASSGFSTEPGTTYQWQVSGTPGGPYANVTGGTGATSPSYTTGALATGTYYYVMQTSCSGPGTDLSNELQVIVNVAPSTSNAGPDQGVVSASATLAGNTPVAGSGQWSVIAGAGVFVNDTDPGTIVNGLSAGINTFRWTISGTFCPVSTDDVDIIFSNCINPVATISGDAQICTGGSTSLTLNFTGLAPWMYAINGGATASTSSNPETVIVNPASSTVFNITSFSDALCTGLFSGSATVTVTNAPPSSSCTITSSPTEGCIGNVVVVSTSVVPGATSYTWFAPAGTLINGSPSPVTTLTNAANITLGPVASGSSGWQICAFASNVCGQTNTNCKYIRGVLSTPAPIVGSTIACPNTGGVNNYSTGPIGGASSYLWTITGDATVTGTGTDASVSFGAGFTNGSLCVRALLACGYQSAPRCMTISNSTPLLSAMSGTFSVCPGTNGVAYTVLPSVGAASYSWTLPSGATIVSGANTNSITVDFGAGFLSGNICVTAVSLCGANSIQRCKTISTITPGVPGNISGASTGVCGQTITYSVPSVSGATSYTWTAPGGASLGSLNGTNTMSIIYPSNFATGSLCVTANNACGTGSPRCINVKGVSANPGAISGPATVCANDLADVYTVSPVFGSTNYQWTTPSGSTIVSGQGTNSIIVDWGSNGGVIGVTALGPCGNSGTRTLNVTMNCRISGNATEEMNISAYPNPAKDILNLSVISESKEIYSLQLIDYSGRIVSSSTWKVMEGKNTKSIDISGIAKGMYQLTILNSKGASTHVQVAVQ